MYLFELSILSFVSRAFDAHQVCGTRVMYISSPDSRRRFRRRGSSLPTSSRTTGCMVRAEAVHAELAQQHHQPLRPQRSSCFRRSAQATC